MSLATHPLSADPTDDPVLRRLRATLETTYGDNVERVVLYGSRARGGAREDSDYDIAIFLHNMTDRFKEMDRLADIGTKLLHENGMAVHAFPFHAGSYVERTPIMHEIRKDGLDLWTRKRTPSW